MKKIFFFVIFLLCLTLSINPQPITSKTSTVNNSFANLRGKLLLEKESKPILNIITFNQTKIGSSILVAYMTHIESYFLDIITQEIKLVTNKTFGMNDSSYLWKVKQDSICNFIAALSNGSIFSFTFLGALNWIHSFSSASVSDLSILKSGLCIAISDSGQLFWFNSSNGNKIKELTINNTYFTILKSFDNYFVAGNNNGTIYVFNSTKEILSTDIGQSQVISLAINDYTIAAFSFNHSLVLFNTASGTKIPISNYTDLDYNSLFLFNNTLYFSDTTGKFTAYNLTTNSKIWSDNNVYADHVLISEFTGNQIPDMISFSITGNLLVINPKNGTIIKSEVISNSQITAVTTLNINNDNITDLMIGTRLGELFLYAGKDLTPPYIISDTLKASVTDSTITLFFQTNEEATMSITYFAVNQTEFTAKNDTLDINHLYVINNLKSDTNYTLIIGIADQGGNSNNITLTNVSTKPAPAPIFLYGAACFMVLIGATGGIFYIRKIQIKKRAFQEAEMYYESGEYILAIKSYIKANNKEKIIDIITFLVSNPQLSSFVNEIKQMEELNAYMVDIQEIIQSQEI